MRNADWSDGAAEPAGYKGDSGVPAGPGLYGRGSGYGGSLPGLANYPAFPGGGFTVAPPVTYGTGVAPVQRAASGALDPIKVDARAGEVATLIMERHKKYGPKNIANSPGGALNGIVVRLYDKLSRLGNTKDDFADESLRDTLLDVAGYALIGLLVVDGQWPGAEQ